MNFGTVFPGEKYTPSATQQNLLNQMLSNYNTGMTVGGVPDNSLFPQSTRIYVREPNGYSLAFGQVVYIIGTSGTPDVYGNIVYDAVSYFRLNGAYAGIAVMEATTSSLTPVATAVISGLAICLVDYSDITTTSYVGKVEAGNRSQLIPSATGYDLLYSTGTPNGTGYGIVLFGGQEFPKYLFGVNVYQQTDEEGNTRTYANIYSVPKWIKVFGYTKASPLIPTVIDITEALAQGSVEIGVKIVGNDNEDITVGNPVCQYVINGSQGSRPLQPWAKFATITMSSTAGAKVSAIPYNNGVFDIDGFSGVPSCWSYYNNGEIKIVCPETYTTIPHTNDVPQAIFDYVDNYVLYCVLTYNDADSTYSAAWQWSDITTMKNTEMYIPVLYNYNDDKMTAKTYFNFFAYYLL